MITIYCVGKIKESFYRQAADEYVKRLGRYDRIKINETADEKTPDGAGAALKAQIRKKEGNRLLKQIRDTEYVIALAIEGRKLDSEAFAGKIADLKVSGRSEIAFVIGGSLGLSDEVMRRADDALSFSDLTFPHQLMRVILLEQIYRAEKILAHEPYHK